MILSDTDIKAQRSMVCPFKYENVQPASIDLTLDTTFLICPPHANRFVPPIDLADPQDSYGMEPLVAMVDPDGVVLWPGEFCLGATAETVDIPFDIAGRIEGKSSLARLGLIIHAAGFIDPGFKGKLR